jgi:hypothetical protein
MGTHNFVLRMEIVANYISEREFSKRDGTSCSFLKRMALGGVAVGHSGRRQVAPVMIEGTHFVVAGGRVLLNARYRVIRGKVIRMG